MWQNLPQRQNGELLQYRVEEAAVLGYTTSYSAAVSGAGANGEEKTLTVTNTLEKTSYVVEKVWQDADGAALPPNATVVLYRKTASSSEEQVVQPGIEPVRLLTAAGGWTYIWSGLLKYNSAGEPYIYSVRETHIGGIALGETFGAAGYQRVSQVDSAGKTTITNKLLRHVVRVNKAWNYYGYDTGVAKITVQLQRKNADNTWSAVAGKTMDMDVGTASAYFTGIQTYDLNGVAYEYRVIEKSLTLTDDTVVNAASEGGNPLTGTIGAYRFTTVVAGNTTTITNTLIRMNLSGAKTWDDDQDYYGIRPENLTLSVKNNGIALTPQPAINWTKSGGAWQYAVEGLARYNPDGTPAVYSVSETVPAGYTAASGTVSGIVDALTGYVTDANLKNTLNTFSISGTKIWDDQHDRYGFRPQSIALTVLYDGVALATQPKPTQIVWSKDGDVWQYTISGLPKPGSAASAGRYSVAEAAITGYTRTGVTAGAVDPVTVDVSGINLTNALDTGTLTLIKRTQNAGNETEFFFKAYYRNLQDEWVLYTGAYTHVDSANIETLQTTGANGVITLRGGASIAQERAVLHDYPAGQYRIEELSHTDFNQTAAVNASGTLARGGTVTADFTNTYLTRIKIDNNTVNPSNPAKTDVGGRVAVAGTNPAAAQPNASDGVDYEDNGVAVAWAPDLYYTCGRSFTVSYRAYGASDISQITVTGYLDDGGVPKPISDPIYDELRAVYPDAQILRNSTGAIYLRLSTNAWGMPPQTSVAVEFLPTLAVENTTRGNLGGTVKVEGGVENNRSDGVPAQDGQARYAANAVYGTALNGYRVDLNNLTIGLPATSNGDVGGNTRAVKIQLDRNGNFTVTIHTVINAAAVSIPVGGRVEIIDASGQRAIRVVLNSLSIPLDIGIPFIYNTSDSDDSSDETNTPGPTTEKKPQPDVPEERFWENVNALIEKAQAGDRIKVNVGTYENIPQAIYDALQKNPGITLEITYNNGQIKILGAVDTSANPVTGGIWEVSAPGSTVYSTQPDRITQPGTVPETAVTQINQAPVQTAEKAPEPAGEHKKLSGWVTIGSLLTAGLAYLYKKAAKKRRT